MVSHCDWGIKGRFRTTQGEIAIDFVSPLLEKKRACIVGHGIHKEDILTASSQRFNHIHS